MPFVAGDRQAMPGQIRGSWNSVASCTSLKKQAALKREVEEVVFVAFVAVVVVVIALVLLLLLLLLVA